MQEHVDQRESYEESVEGETDDNIKNLMHAHLSLATWQPGGRFSTAVDKIWVRVVRREARRRGLL
jgi:hypothetical protein